MGRAHLRNCVTACLSACLGRAHLRNCVLERLLGALAWGACVVHFPRKTCVCWWQCRGHAVHRDVATHTATVKHNWPVLPRGRLTQARAKAAKGKQPAQPQRTLGAASTSATATTGAASAAGADSSSSDEEPLSRQLIRMTPAPRRSNASYGGSARSGGATAGSRKRKKRGEGGTARKKVSLARGGKNTPGTGRRGKEPASDNSCAHTCLHLCPCPCALSLAPGSWSVNGNDDFACGAVLPVPCCCGGCSGGGGGDGNVTRSVWCVGGLCTAMVLLQGRPARTTLLTQTWTNVGVHSSH